MTAPTRRDAPPPPIRRVLMQPANLPPPPTRVVAVVLPVLAQPGTEQKGNEQKGNNLPQRLRPAVAANPMPNPNQPALLVVRGAPLIPRQLVPMNPNRAAPPIDPRRVHVGRGHTNHP